MFDALISPPWAVVFGFSLALALFIVKFAVARSPKFDDVIVAAADIPTVLTATACSLLVAAAAHATEWRNPASQTALLLIIFVINVCVLRFVESRRRSLGSVKFQIAGSISFSYLISIFVALNLVSRFYIEIQP